MEMISSAKGSWYYAKLRTLTLEIGMEVLHHYFEQKILNDSTFWRFLDENKHYLFHACYPNVKCCECSNSMLVSSSKKESLSKIQFDLLFVTVPPSERNHCQTGRQIVKKQNCLCKFEANKNNELDCMDITLMWAILNSVFYKNQRSIHGNPTDFETIKKTRNFLAHESSQHITEPEFNSKWDETEKAISDIAKTVGNYFAKTIKRKVDEFNQAPLPTEDIKKTLRAVLMMLKR